MKYQKDKLYKLENKIIKILLLFSILLISVYLSIDTYMFSNQFQKITLNNAIHKIEERETYLNSYIKNSKLQLSSINKTTFFQEYVENKDFNSLNNLFLFVANSQKNIMQIRYIDKDGNERSRVERAGITSIPMIVEESKLQNKSKRDYFLHSKKENNADIWFTSLDLNKEYGKIEIPYKVTLRAILPLQKNGKFNGIIIINYFMNDFMDSFLEDDLYDSILIDEEGYILIHYDKDKSWSRYKKPQIKFTENLEILNEDKYKNSDFVSKKLNIPVFNTLILILKLDEKYINDERYNSFLSKFFNSLIIMFFSIVLIVIISRIFKKLVLDIINYTEYTEMIDENIITSSTDLQGNITYASKAFCRISGYKESELLGRNHNIVRHPDEDSNKYKELWDALLADKIWEGEFKNISREGKAYWVRAKIYPIFDRNIKVGYTAIRQNITDKKTIEKLSITDSLTGLYNRKHFDEILPKILNDVKRKNELISFIMIDVDLFKNYNDTYGHQSGDNVLINIGKVLKDTLKRSSDYSFRIGGEEFVCVCKPESKDDIKIIAENLRKNVENLRINHGDNVEHKYVTISLGVATLNAMDIKNYEDLYKIADKLLYEAKNNGRNTIVYLNN